MRMPQMGMHGDNGDNKTESELAGKEFLTPIKTSDRLNSCTFAANVCKENKKGTTRKSDAPLYDYLFANLSNKMYLIEFGKDTD